MRDPRRAALSLLVLLGSLTSGCGGSSIELTQFDHRWKVPPASKYPNAERVALLQTQHVRILGDDQWRTQYREEIVFAVLREAGRDANYRRVLYWGELDEIRGRVIQPDGTVVEIEPGALLNGLTVSAGKTQHRTIAISLPKLRLGSVVELQLSWTTTGLHHSRRFGPEFRGPIERYELTVDATPNVMVGMGLHHASKGISRTTGPLGWQLKWVQTQSPTPFWQRFSPSRWSFQPWASVEIKRIHRWRPTESWWRLFDGAQQKLKRRLPQLLDGLALKLSVSDDCDIGCRIGKVVGAVSALGWARGLGDLELLKEPLNDAIGSGGLSTAERTVIAWHMLDGLGIKAELALSVPNLGYHPGQPLGEVFVRPLLFLPKQPGIDKRLFVDATCGWCAVGQLPPDLINTPAMRLGPPDAPIKAQPIRVAGKPAPIGATKTQYTLHLAAEGSRLEQTTRHTGADGLARRKPVATDSKIAWHKRALKWAARINGTLLRDEHPSCDVVSSACTRIQEAKLSGLGIYWTPKRVDVAFDFIERRTATWLPDDARKRPVEIPAGRLITDNVVAIAPKGWRFVKLPTPQLVASRAFEYRLEVTAHSPGKVELNARLWLKPGRYEPLRGGAEAIPTLRAPLEAFDGFARHALVLEPMDPPAVPKASAASAATAAAALPGEQPQQAPAQP